MDCRIHLFKEIVQSSEFELAPGWQRLLPGPSASLLLGSRLATGAPGACGFTLSSRLLLGLGLCFSRYQDCRCGCWSLGFHFTSPWAGSWCCCWGLALQFAVIQICGWVLGLHLLVLQPSCTCALL